MASSCPLSDPHIGVITEIEHKVGTCLCQLCTCGSHPCPGKAGKGRHMSFQTSYNLAYQGPGVTYKTRRRSPAKPYYPSQWKMERQTSMQRDFPKHDRMEVYRPLPRSVSPPLNQSVSLSAYRADFPNWGPSGVPNKHIPNLPLRAQDIRFQGKSSYKRDFTRSESATQSFDSRYPSRPSNMPIGLPKLSYATGTTSQQSFPNPLNWKLNSRVNAPKEDVVQLHNPQCHHMTTSRSDYQLKSAQGIDLNVKLRLKLAVRHKALL